MQDARAGQCAFHGEEGSPALEARQSRTNEQNRTNPTHPTNLLYLTSSLASAPLFPLAQAVFLPGAKLSASNPNSGAGLASGVHVLPSSSDVSLPCGPTATSDIFVPGTYFTAERNPLRPCSLMSVHVLPPSLVIATLSTASFSLL